MSSQALWVRDGILIIGGGTENSGPSRLFAQRSGVGKRVLEQEFEVDEGELGTSSISCSKSLIQQEQQNQKHQFSGSGSFGGHKSEFSIRSP